MDDLISRQAAIDILEEQIRLNGYSNVGMVSAINKSIGQIMRLPTAEPRKGKWIDYCGGVKCDQCGFECDDTYYLDEANFCPNCGARMEESE